MTHKWEVTVSTPMKDRKLVTWLVKGKYFEEAELEAMRRTSKLLKLNIHELDIHGTIAK